jgi:hypothetical protein
LTSIKYKLVPDIRQCCPKDKTSAVSLRGAAAGRERNGAAKVTFGFLSPLNPFDWNCHAFLMLGTWFVLVPLGIITIRFGKPRPRPHGLRGEIKLTNPEWWWFSIHKFGLYLAIGLALLGAALALTASGGFSGSPHAIFGLTAVALGCLQIVSAWLRGRHGGRYYFTADPNDPATWRGDHYDMTPRRRRFEAYHKTAGYFAGFFALAAAASGLMQFPMPTLATLIPAWILLVLTVCVVLEYKGLRYDGYRAAFGNDPDHPHNLARKDL